MQKRTFPPRFAVRAYACAAILIVTASCGGGGGDAAPTSPGSSNQTISSVSITGNATSVAVGSTITLGATALNSSGGSVATTFTWTSANTAVALVGSATGVVSGVAAGSTAITASAGGQNGVRVITVTAAGQPPPPATQATIEMPGAAFSPNAVSVVVGGTVTFVFTALPHNVFFGGGAGKPADIPITSNQVIQRTFTAAGQFNINCTLHPGMSGVITVQ